MIEVKWSSEKSERLKKTRGVNFEKLFASELVAIKSHSTKDHQRFLFFRYKNYIWVVPCVIESETAIFLKTLYRSRRYNKLYLKGKLK